MSSPLERVLSATLTVAAVVMAAVLVKREFFPSPRGPVNVPVSGELELDPEWRTYLAHAHVQTPATAPVVLIEFVDIECPACRGFHVGALSAARAEYGAQLDVRYVHWPLPSHRFARPGAEAAECAGQQGRLPEYLEAVFARQDSLGLKAWVSYATDAGITDTSAFSGCLRNPAVLRARIDSGVAIAERRDFFGTPTILVNGWRFPGPPSELRLRQVIEDLLAGREPRR